tara:strand:+ start:170 stop:430 length:261 start_codon:yes stop_codon:yes gene_type:complete
MEEKIKSTNSQLYKVLNIEAHAINMKQIDVSEKVKKQNGNLWMIIKKNTVKFNVVCAICNVLDLEIVIRNKRINCEYIINKKQKES